MPIKKRASAPVIDYSEVDDRPWFEKAKDQPAKARKPLPEPYLIPGVRGIPDTTRHEVMTIGAMFSNDEARKEGHELNVADLLHAVRTPYNDDTQEARYRARIRNRGTAITSFCMDCTGGSRKQVTECSMTDCPLWAFRFGSDPFRGK